MPGLDPGIHESATARKDSSVARFGIPVDSLREWEQCRALLDALAQNCLRVIANMPNEVAKVCEPSLIMPPSVFTQIRISDVKTASPVAAR